MRGLFVLLACVGCDFHHGALESVTADGEGGDGTHVLVPVHLGPGDGVAGSAPLGLTGVVMVNTSVPSISVALPEGDTLDVRPQLGSGPELAVLHVGSLDVASGAVVTIVGTRPLVIVAAGAASIAGTLDAGAHGVTPGAGGSPPAMGDGKGQPGQHEASQESDSGGGGAGFGTAGAAGGLISGTCTVASGAEGTAYGDANIAMLVGGSGGGGSSGSQCTPDLGGAGGGALQITAPMIAIDATGKVLAGGGGGRGGTDCGMSDVNSGPGGGSGGAIYLQATTIMNAGVIAANGGGGGGSSSTGSGSAMPGADGGSSTAQAAGGTGPRAMGGKGGSADGAPTIGGNSSCGTNAGGGGGAVGRIALVGMVSGAGVTSP